MSDQQIVENSQSFTELLKAMNEIKQKLQSKKAENLEQLKTRAINLQKQIDDANAEISEVIQMLKSLEATPEELAEFPPQITSAFTVKGRKGRASVLYNGQPMSASAVCQLLGLEIGGDSAVRVLQRYLKAHPSENIKIL
jgi:DNA repair exonuclease SbcCD ATPase subunit